jgi:hypothetical protein
MYGKEQREGVFEGGKVSSNHDCSTRGVALMAADSLGSMTCANDSISQAHAVSLRRFCLGARMGLRAA